MSLLEKKSKSLQAYRIWKFIPSRTASSITVFLLHLTLKCQARSHFEGFVPLPLLGVLLSQCPHLLLPYFLHVFNQFSLYQMGWVRLSCSNKQPKHLRSLKQVILHVHFGWLGHLHVVLSPGFKMTEQSLLEHGWWRQKKEHEES